MALPRPALTGQPVDEPDGAIDRPRSDDTMATIGPGGMSTDYVLSYGAGGGGAGLVPQWPAPQRGPNRRVAVFAISGLVAAIVAVIVLGALLANTVQSMLSSPNGQGTSLPAAATSPHTATPLPSPTVTPSPTPVTTWLVANPTQIDLTCHGSKTITVTNQGPEAVSWSASSSSFFVAVSPESGSLPAGKSVRLSVSIRFGALAPSNGIITIAAEGNQQAGQPAAVSFSTTSCKAG